MELARLVVVTENPTGLVIFDSDSRQGRRVLTEPLKDLLLARCVVARSLSPLAKTTKPVPSKETFKRRCVLTEGAGEEEDFVLKDPRNAPRENSPTPERLAKGDESTLDVGGGATPMLAKRRGRAGQGPL